MLGRLTLAEFLEKWLDFVKPSVRTRTWEGYESIVRVHIVPKLDTLPLDKVRPMHLRLLAHCASPDAKRLSAS
jgi:integrase